MTTEQTANTARISRAEYLLWFMATLFFGLLLVPGGGLILGIVLALTRFKHVSGIMRWSLAILGLLLVAVQLVGLLDGSSSNYLSEISEATKTH